MSDQVEQTQPPLFDLEEDGALLFSPERLRESKRYTAEQVQNLEWKRGAIVMLLASDWPVEIIAERIHVSTRTVRAIAAQAASEVAGASKMFAKVCSGLGARWFGLAKTREQEASFLQLVTGAAIAVDKSVLLESMGQIADVSDTKEAPDRAAAMAALRAMMTRPADQVEPGTDVASDKQPPIISPSPSLPANDAPTDAPGPPALDPGQAPEPPAHPEGGGGGQQAAGPPGGPMDCQERGLQQRDPLSATDDV